MSELRTIDTNQDKRRQTAAMLRKVADEIESGEVKYVDAMVLMACRDSDRDVATYQWRTAPTSTVEQTLAMLHACGILFVTYNTRG